jgi:hypothetical protein
LSKRDDISAAVMPTVSLQEHLEKLSQEREHSAERLAAERELRYQQLREEREQRYQDLRAADAKAVEAAFSASKEAIAAALTAQEKAALVTESRTAKSFADANEWRSTYADRDRLQVPRTEYAAGILTLADKIDSLASDRDRGSGARQGALDTRQLVFALVALALAVAGYFAGKGG